MRAVRRDAAMPASAPQDLLNIPPPELGDTAAARLAREHFGLPGALQRLDGERDRNFLVGEVPGQRCVLKFVNRGEPLVQTQFQVAVLRHLAARDAQGLAPRHVATRDGADHLDLLDDTGLPCRARAYSYLEGKPAAKVFTGPQHRRALGSAVAAFDHALAGFHHPGVQREFLWDLMQLGRLAPYVQHIADTGLREMAARFITAFERSIAPELRSLRQQVIHNDLSPSNYLVAPEDDNTIAGILDFGDMAHAPLLCDLAIAASYQMGDAHEPLAALDEVAEGFGEVIPLLPQERELLLDAVLARVVQRVVITEWRAARFPANRAYILRHTAAARRLLVLLAPVWRACSRHGGAARHASTSLPTP